MKELLERIWHDKKCRCPCHVVLWARFPVRQVYKYNREATENAAVYWIKGRKLPFKVRRH